MLCDCVARYCPSCKTDSSEVIGAGEKMRLTKKKANMKSKKNECNRDWGKVGGASGWRDRRAELACPREIYVCTLCDLLIIIITFPISSTNMVKGQQTM